MTLGTALVTGAGRGIGRAIALRLAKDGYNVAVNDLGPKGRLASLQDELKALGRESIECIADVTNELEVKGMVDQTVQELGGLDVMVANAGMSFTKPFLRTTMEDWDRVFNLNGKGVFLCYQYAAKAMIEQGRGGRLIGASSIAGKQGWEMLSLYSASKFTVRSLTQTAAQELKPYGITVNAYAPGLIETELAAEYVADMKKWGEVPQIPEVIGQPEEIAGLVSYLVSKEAQFITGQSVSINGGAYCD